MRKSSVLPLLAALLALSMMPFGYAGPLRDLLLQRAAERRAASDGGDSLSGLTDKGPFELPPGTGVLRDLAYGSDPAQTLDVYRPAHAQGAPVILMVHGGGWRHGDKGLHRVVKNKVRHYLAKGWVLVSINTRLLPQADPLQQAEDVGRALSYAQAHAAEWGGDATRFLLVGHSAGAHLVALVSSDPSIATRKGAQPWLGTVALDSAAYDVVQIMESQHFRLYDDAFRADPAFWREASPSWRLKGAPAVPMLLVCSSRRGDSCHQAQGFADKANAAGGKVRVAPQDLSHAEINDRLGTEGPYTTLVDAFLDGLVLR